MDTHGFEKGLKLLDHRFRGGKSTPEATGKLYFSRLQSIPSEAWLWICEAAIEDFKVFPTPGELRKLWHEWRAKNPERIAKPPKTDCPECLGRGLIWARKPVVDLERLFGHYEQTTVFRCAKCQNWQGQVPEYTKSTTVSALRADGYQVELIDPQDPPPPEVAQEIVRSLATNMLKSVPPLPSQPDLEQRRLKQKADLDRYLADQEEPPF